MNNKKINGVSVFVTAVGLLLLLAAVLPLLYLSKYAHPCADDYSYGYMAHEAWMNTHSIVETVREAYVQVQVSYNSWQGTHTSLFLMALSPAVFEDFIPYGISTYILLGMLVISVMCIFNAVFVKLLKVPGWMSLFVTCITLFWMIEAIYSPVNGLFWFNGSVHYLFMHSCMLLMVSSVISYYAEYNSKNRLGIKILYLFLASFFAFMCGGANYSTALTGICILFLLIVWIGEIKKRRAVVIPFVVYGSSFMISVLAPGNAARSENFEGRGPVYSIVESFVLAFKDDIRWFDFQTVIILLLLIPVMYSMAKNLDLKKKYWIVIVSILMFYGLHASLNVPLFYSMGGAGLERQENICKLWFQLGVIFNAFLIVCVLRPFANQRVNKAKEKVQNGRYVRVMTVVLAYYLLIGVMLLVHVKVSDKTIFQYSSYMAYIEVKSGEADEYYNTYKARREILNGATDEVILPDYSKTPYLLYFDDITSDVKDWRNVAFARWYHVPTVKK